MNYINYMLFIYLIEKPALGTRISTVLFGLDGNIRAAAQGQLFHGMTWRILIDLQRTGNYLLLRLTQSEGLY